MRAFDLSVRFHALGDVLAEHAHFWRPNPFHELRPAWCGRHPALAARLRELADGDVEAIAGDNHALIALLAEYVPVLDVLHGLIRVQALTDTAVVDDSPRLRRLLVHVPGRKQDQITAFVAGMGEVAHPVLEWCAGKGHLGRLLAWHQPHPVTSLEIRPDLVEAGVDLARRQGLAQYFVCGDALAPEALAHVADRHAVALHACGDLHLALLRGVAAAGAPALDLAPCCYYRTVADRYVPLCDDAGLSLSRDELHLAVTETVTAGQRDRRRSDMSAAWKLAFLEWRAGAGVPRQKTFKPVPDRWLGLGFRGWMERMCRREGVPAPADGEWGEIEEAGWHRQAEVRRLDLVRLAFRRPLELWLVLDRALFLERRGYRVRVYEFCARALTPRNLLISARHLPALERFAP
ncbi:MAG: methyltransferase [Thiobacillus sp.]|nr:methyltransferase [Thiobacillus sp.]